MSDKILIELPFTGFYDSVHSAMLEDAVMDQISYDLFEKSEYDLTEDEAQAVFDAVYNVTPEQWDKMHIEYCKKIVEAFASEYDLPSLEFESMTSPREYNFESDRLFCLVDFKELKELCKQIDFKGFADYVHVYLMPRDGFIPHYSNNVDDWGLFKDWDFNQYCMMLSYYTQDDDFEMLLDFPVNELVEI